MPNTTLFDLLARSWQGRAAIDRLCFNSDDTLLAIASADGALALARLADNEPPESRIVVDNGQTTIRPREGRPSPLIKTRIEGARRLASASGGDILVLAGTGDLLRVNRSGEIAAKVMADKTPITAFDHCRRSGMTAVAIKGLLRLQSDDADDAPIRETPLTGEPVEILSASGDGQHIALAAPDRLIVCTTTGSGDPLHDIVLSDRPLSLQWSIDGRWLACGLLSGGFCLVEIASGNGVMLTDFPAPVASLDWSLAASAVFASGAYRIAGWSMDAPPLTDSATGALAAGQAGFVIVNAIAAHPVKPLVAAGYANGRIIITSIGSSEEMVVRNAGGPVTTLQWSSDGRHLAAGDALGSASIVTFPERIFK